MPAYLKQDAEEDLLYVELGGMKGSAFSDNGIGTPHGGHHFRLDQGLVRLDRRDLPSRLERRASADPRIAAQLDRLYGELPKLRSAAA